MMIKHVVTLLLLTGLLVSCSSPKQDVKDIISKSQTMKSYNETQNHLREAAQQQWENGIRDTTLYLGFVSGISQRAMMSHWQDLKANGKIIKDEYYNLIVGQDTLEAQLTYKFHHDALTDINFNTPGDIIPLDTIARAIANQLITEYIIEKDSDKEGIYFTGISKYDEVPEYHIVCGQVDHAVTVLADSLVMITHHDIDHLVIKDSTEYKNNRFSYQDVIHWGMPIKDVRQSLNINPRYTYRDMLVYSDFINEDNWETTYIFQSNSLYRIMMNLSKNDGIISNEYILKFKKYEELLTKKYGEPTFSRINWIDGPPPENSTINYGMAVSVGVVSFTARWDLRDKDETMVFLQLKQGDDYFSYILNIYYSNYLEEESASAGL